MRDNFAFYVYLAVWFIFFFLNTGLKQEEEILQQKLELPSIWICYLFNIFRP